MKFSTLLVQRHFFNTNYNTGAVRPNLDIRAHVHHKTAKQGKLL